LTFNPEELPAEFKAMYDKVMAGGDLDEAKWVGSAYSALTLMAEDTGDPVDALCARGAIEILLTKAPSSVVLASRLYDAGQL
jgi:hypothetical protein